VSQGRDSAGMRTAGQAFFKYAKAINPSSKKAMARKTPVNMPFDLTQMKRCASKKLVEMAHEIFFPRHTMHRAGDVEVRECIHIQTTHCNQPDHQNHETQPTHPQQPVGDPCPQR
jgi:hypothetical protein